MYYTVVNDKRIILCYTSGMGHREDLLEGAKRCLSEKGYARTTARDIVAASGTNLASIGYHYGSKDALLVAAMVDAMAEWGDEINGVLSTEVYEDPMEQIEAIWTRVIESLPKLQSLLVANFEALAQIRHSPELRARLSEAQELARYGLAAMFQRVEESAVDEKTARTLGSLQLAILNGLMTQWLLDPASAPSGRELADGLRAIVASVQAARK